MHHDPKSNQRGFTVIEMMVALGVMLIVSGVILALVRDTMKVAVSTFELTDTQSNLRTAQEFLHKDLLNTGDGLRSIKKIWMPPAFVTSYLTLTPPSDSTVGGVTYLGLIMSDNNVPAATAVPQSSPAATVRTGTDRQAILEIDNTFTPVALPTSPQSINSAGTTAKLPVGTVMTNYTVGEIYFLTSGQGGTFACVTAIDTTNRVLTFANGDAYGLNLNGTANLIKNVSSSGTSACSLQRMKIIHYYVTSTGLLMRRVFGVKGAGFRESPVAEHIVNVQFSYSLAVIDLATGNVVPSTVSVLTTTDQASVIRQVDVKITAETTHPMPNGQLQQMTTTTGTSVRNMQFRQALQP